MRDSNVTELDKDSHSNWKQGSVSKHRQERDKNDSEHRKLHSRGGNIAVPYFVSLLSFDRDARLLDSREDSAARRASETSQQR